MIDAGKVLGRGIAFPPHIGPHGRLTRSDGELEIREARHIILMTEYNERLRLPDFGGNLGPFLFEPNTVTTRHLLQENITRALQQWEPRIVVQSVEVEADPSDAQAAIAAITYQLVATQVRERVSLRITFAS